MKPKPAAGVDIARVKENHGDKLTLIGGFDSTDTMSFGTPQDVIADVKKCLKAAMPGGGYIAGTSHGINQRTNRKCEGDGGYNSHFW